MTPESLLIIRLDGGWGKVGPVYLKYSNDAHSHSVILLILQ